MLRAPDRPCHLRPLHGLRDPVRGRLGTELHIVETDRLLIRELVEDDAEAVYVWSSDPEVMRYINGGTPTTRAVVEREILPVFVRYDERCPVYGFWAVERKESGEWLGWISFRPSGETPDQVTLGYRLRRAAWADVGHGRGQRARQ